MITRKRGYCAHCVAVCPTIAIIEDGIFLKVIPDPDHPNAVSHLCPKGLAGPEMVYSDYRIKHPMRRTKPKGAEDPGWEKISWEEALETTAKKLNENKDKFGPESVAFYRSSPAGTQAAEFNNLAYRLAFAFGSPNTLATTHICQWSRDVVSSYTYGVGLLDAEFNESGCMMLWGQNPKNTWISMDRELSKGMEQDGKLIVIDPKNTKIAEKADLWLQLLPGTDLALALSFISVILSEELYDKQFTTYWTTAPFLVRCDTNNFLKESDVFQNGNENSYMYWDEKKLSLETYIPAEKQYSDVTAPQILGNQQLSLTNGKQVECKPVFQMLKEHVEQYNPSWGEKITGVTKEKILEAARMFATIKPASYYTWNGIEQHVAASQTNRAICMFYSLTGNFDTKGSNRFFPRIPLNPDTGYEFLSPETEAKRLGYFTKPLGPAGPIQPNKATRSAITSYDFYEAVLNNNPYSIKALVAFGGNLITGNPDSLIGKQALEKLEFYAHVDLFLNPSAEFADIVLPASSFWETTGIRPGFRNNMDACRHIQLREPVVPPQHESRPDVDIIFDLAEKLGLGSKFWDGDREKSLNYSIEKTGLTVDDLRQHPGGMTLDYSATEKNYKKINPGNNLPYGFNTPSGKIELYSQLFKDYGFDPLPVFRESYLPQITEEYPLILTCYKSSVYSHGMGRCIPSLRKQVPEPFVEIYPETALKLNLKDGDWASIETVNGRMQAKVIYMDTAMPNVVHTQHGWWQDCKPLKLPGYDPYSATGSNVNLITTGKRYDPINGSIPLKGIACRIIKRQY